VAPIRLQELAALLYCCSVASMDVGVKWIDPTPQLQVEQARQALVTSEHRPCRELSVSSPTAPVTDFKLSSTWVTPLPPSGPYRVGLLLAGQMAWR
jgi:hypothetical protein